MAAALEPGFEARCRCPVRLALIPGDDAERDRELACGGNQAKPTSHPLNLVVGSGRTVLCFPVITMPTHGLGGVGLRDQRFEKGTDGSAVEIGCSGLQQVCELVS